MRLKQPVDDISEKSDKYVEHRTTIAKLIPDKVTQALRKAVAENAD